VRTIRARRSAFARGAGDSGRIILEPARLARAGRWPPCVRPPGSSGPLSTLRGAVPMSPPAAPTATPRPSRGATDTMSGEPGIPVASLRGPLAAAARLFRPRPHVRRRGARRDSRLSTPSYRRRLDRSLAGGTARARGRPVGHQGPGIPNDDLLGSGSRQARNAGILGEDSSGQGPRPRLDTASRTCPLSLKFAVVHRSGGSPDLTHDHLD
jgi:hypothetical protein